MKLTIRTFLFIFLAFYLNEIVSIILQIGGTPYKWIIETELPPISFANFNSTFLVILGICLNGSVALIALILLIILTWNFIKLLLEAAERYIF